MIYDITTLYSWHQSYYISPHTDYIYYIYYIILYLYIDIYIDRDIDNYNIYYSYYLQCSDYTTSTIHVTWNPLYVWHHRNSIWHHTHSLWHNNTVSMISHPLYSWQHTTLYDITYFILETSQRLYLWQDPSCVYDIIHSIDDISHGV